MIEARSFDVLVYLDRSRLGRKASLSMAIVELCHASGIAICETESGGELIYGATYDQLLVGAIKSVAAQQEITKLTERHRMGMLARVQRGDWPNTLPWGCTYLAGVMDLDRYAKQVKAVQTKLDALTERMKVLQPNGDAMRNCLRKSKE